LSLGPFSGSVSEIKNPLWTAKVNPFLLSIISDNRPQTCCYNLQFSLRKLKPDKVPAVVKMGCGSSKNKHGFQEVTPDANQDNTTGPKYAHIHAYFINFGH
jgi:hypothetical protein